MYPENTPTINPDSTSVGWWKSPKKRETPINSDQRVRAAAKSGAKWPKQIATDIVPAACPEGNEYLSKGIGLQKLLLGGLVLL